MQQLSRPYQIALGVLLVLVMAWFTVLKPSDEVAEPALAAPGASGLSAAVTQAEGAAAASAAQAASGSTGPAAPAAATTSADPATTGASGPAGADVGDPSRPILRDVAAGKVAVLLFHSPSAADDRAVRRAVRHADRHGGRMVVRAASIMRVAEYSAITKGVDVTQAPTLLVIGRDNRARSLVGFTDTRAIDQLVADVGGAAFAPRRSKGYRGRVENVCAVIEQSVRNAGLAGPDVAVQLESVDDDLRDARATLERLEAPRPYFGFQRRFEASLDVAIAGFGAMLAAVRKGEDPQAALKPYQARIERADARLQTAAARVGLADGC